MNKLLEILKTGPGFPDSDLTITVDDGEWMLKLRIWGITAVGRSDHSIDTAAERLLSGLDAMKALRDKVG